MKWLLVAPAIVFCLVFTLWPVGELIGMSLTETNFITSRFVGLRNYVEIWKDELFLRSILNSGLYILLVTPMNVGLGLLLAFLVFRESKQWQGFARIAFYIPALSAGIIIGQVWKWVYHIDGPINWFIGLFGVQPVAWFSQAVTAIPAVSIVQVQASFAGGMMIFLAAMLSIDRAIFDAARIDGAHEGQIRRRIILPLIMPAVAMMALLSAISTPQMWETIYVLAPYKHASTMSYQIYQEAFIRSRHGMAAAEALILLGFTAAMSWTKQKVFG